jgi:energy-coupling factor transport system permease protein
MIALGAARSIAYRPRATPLHAARATVAGAYAASIAVAALVVINPLLLGALLVAVLAAAAAAGVGRQLLRAAAVTVLPLVLLTVIVNALVNRGGLTVLVRLGDWGVLGQVNITLEAVVYGLVFSLRLLVVALACLLAVCTADPDQLLFSLRRISPRSALTAALATRLIPVLAEDARRLAEAQRCRPQTDAGTGRARLAILRATVGGALDRSLDIAAVLEMRGYGAGRAGRGRRLPLSRHDLAFAAAAIAIVVVALVVWLDGLARFDTYPLVHASTGPAVWVSAALVLFLALVPFTDRRGIRR